MLKYKYKIADSIGGRQEQQDLAGAAVTKFGLLVVVCDGMGGAKGGATASKMAVNIIIKDIGSSNYQSPVTALTESVKKANAEIFNISRIDENFRGMGTTLAAILIQPKKATIAHAGDSRVYHLRSPDVFGKSMQKLFRTNDHSKVFELVKRGILGEEQARTSDESNVILRALGIKPQVDLEINDNIPYEKGDRFLLCTDGVCGAIPEAGLLELLHQKADVETTVNKLIATIDQMGYQAGGGHDNLTAALIECGSNSDLKAKISMKTKIIMASITALLILSLGYIGYTGSGMGQIQKETEALKLKNDQLQKQVDSLLKENKTLLENSNNAAQKPYNTGKERPDIKHQAPVGQTTEDELIKEEKTIITDPKQATGNKPAQKINAGKVTSKKTGGTQIKKNTEPATIKKDSVNGAGQNQ